MAKNLIKKYWPLWLIYLIVLGIFNPIFSLYFAQDDFFHLKMGTARSLGDFLGFFSFRNPYGYTFYRPLTTQVYTFVLRSLFGLQPLFFRLVSFAFFLANLLFVFKIVEKLIKNRNTAFLTVFLYAINASGLGSLAYISAFQEIGMAFFLFLSFWLYLKNSRWAILLFILALLSKENAVVLPLVLMAYELLLGKKQWLKTIPFWMILIIYGLLRLGGGLLVSPLGGLDVSVYRPVFSPVKILNSYFWYWLWGMGLPEMLIDFIGPGLAVNPRLIGWYGKEMAVIFGITFLLLVLLFIGTLRISKKDRKKIVFFLIWFFVGLLPVIFWPSHKFSFYLTVPLLGLVSLFVLFLKKLPRFLLFLGVLSLFIISLTTINLSWRTYWVITRAMIARGLVVNLLEKHPRLPEGAILYFQNDPDYPQITGWGNSSTQAYYALSGANGPQVIYHDLAIRVYYEDLEKPPEGENIFTLVARIK